MKEVITVEYIKTERGVRIRKDCWFPDHFELITFKELEAFLEVCKKLGIETREIE